MQQDNTAGTDRLREALTDLATSDVLFARHRVIEAIEALRRLDDGLYGICAVCNEHIPKTRLHAKPEATLCVHCQQQQDQHLAA